MEAIDSKIQTHDPEFLSNQSNMQALVSELTGNMGTIRERGDTDAAKLHLSRGKLLSLIHISEPTRPY